MALEGKRPLDFQKQPNHQTNNVKDYRIARMNHQKNEIPVMLWTLKKDDFRYFENMKIEEADKNGARGVRTVRTSKIITWKDVEDQSLVIETGDIREERISGVVMEAGKIGESQNYQKMETQEAQGNGARTKGTSQIEEKSTSPNVQYKVI